MLRGTVLRATTNAISSSSPIPISRIAKSSVARCIRGIWSRNDCSSICQVCKWLFPSKNDLGHLVLREGRSAKGGSILNDPTNDLIRSFDQRERH
jgi:hypothetical protein